jgi:hypothetical protein
VKRHLTAVVVISAIALGSLRIAATYTMFNHTVDEPAHIACGMEWLDRGTYRMEDQHPPLARVLAALGPYLSGIRLQGTWDRDRTPSGMYSEGQHIFYAGGHYNRTLVLARLGILPCFWIACLAVYLWAKRYFGVPTALVAISLFSLLPTVLAHAGLGTTDMALTASLGLAFIAALAWAERPDRRRSAAFGAAGALAILSKFSSLVFFPAAAAVASVAYLAAARPGFRPFFTWMKRALVPLALAAFIAAAIVWAGYRFHYGPVFFAKISLPAPELYSGIRSVWEHNETGHPSYFLGHHSITGWWYFFPVVLAVKTPLPFLFLAAFGAWVSFRRFRQLNGAYLIPLGFSLAILGVGMLGHIDVGVRHILPVYLGLSVTAAVGVVRLSEIARRWARAALWVSLVWLASTSLAAHPDYLPYFNAIAGSEPERIVADSDLDWGQDMTRLATRLRELGVNHVTFRPLVFDDYENGRGLPPMDFGSPLAPSPGWNAVGITEWKVLRMGLNGPGVPWPDRSDFKPVERVGHSILLYYIRP